MKKKIIIILLVLVALSSIFFINLGNKSTAQECNDCTPIPTPPGDSYYSKINCNCTGAIPTIKTSADTIASGGSITLWVDSGGKACPDLTWSVSSTKYSLNKFKTTADLETVTMTAASGACSSTGYNNSNIYVTVTVTDKCGITNQIEIRNAVGGWKNFTFECLSEMCGSPTTYYKIVGNKKYYVSACYNGAEVYGESICSLGMENCSLPSRGCSSYYLDENYSFGVPSDIVGFKTYPGLDCYMCLSIGHFGSGWAYNSVGYETWGCP
jgi:hypothetical protein